MLWMMKQTRTILKLLSQHFCEAIEKSWNTLSQDRESLGLEINPVNPEYEEYWPFNYNIQFKNDKGGLLYF
jgi:hypothetical protein